ncbi:MAG: hypothetical protein ACK4SY_06315, partial [Pyrobaculum sp.]
AAPAPGAASAPRQPPGGGGASTLEDLTQFIDIGVRAGAVRPEDAQRIIAAVKAMRGQIPSWIWEAVDRLKQDIMAGREQVPLPTTQEQVASLRRELGLGAVG